MAESHKDGVQLILPDSSCLNDMINTMLKPDKCLTGNLYFTVLFFRTSVPLEVSPLYLTVEHSLQRRPASYRLQAMIAV